MFWVDNAPGAYSEARPLSYFLPQWSFTFGSEAPSAALFGTTGSGDPRLFSVNLADPAYDEVSGELSYTATLQGMEAGTLPVLDNVMLSIPSGRFTRFPILGKGAACQTFGHGYDPSTANTAYIYFGSEIARKQDYDFYDDSVKANYGTLTIGERVKTSVYDAVLDAYKFK